MTDIEFYFWYFMASLLVVRIACWLDRRDEMRRHQQRNTQI